jgi:hypothetical protein
LPIEIRCLCFKNLPPLPTLLQICLRQSLLGKTLLFHCENLHSVEKVCTNHIAALGDCLTSKLTDLGFSKGIICEIILSTYDKDKTPNAAPMGVVMESYRNTSIDIFNSSQTYRNLQASRCGVINITSDVEIFYRTAFKETNPEGILPPEWFMRSEAVSAPKLCSADGTVDISVVSEKPLSLEKNRVLCKVEQINARQMCPRVYCRARSATIEAIIHATRVKLFITDKSKQQRIGQLLDLIENCNDLVNRTAPNSKYSTVMADLLGSIDSWRNR